jgi:hypothetical protein
MPEPGSSQPFFAVSIEPMVGSKASNRTASVWRFSEDADPAAA